MFPDWFPQAPPPDLPTFRCPSKGEEVAAHRPAFPLPSFSPLLPGRFFGHHLRPVLSKVHFGSGLHRSGESSISKPSIGGGTMHARQPGGLGNGQALTVGIEKPPLCFAQARQLRFY